MASRPVFEARCDLPVPLAVVVERRYAVPLVAYATNLSPSGACLHLDERLAVGDAVLLRLRVPGEPEPFTARGRVTWCEAPEPVAAARFLEAGVRFEVVSDVDRDRIQRFVRSCEPSAAPARSGPS